MAKTVGGRSRVEETLCKDRLAARLRGTLWLRSANLDVPNF